METDEELEEFIGEPFLGEEIDLDFEFDAPTYHDFTRPESEQETREAECWFKFVGSYPPSPFVIKLNWGNEAQAGYTSVEVKGDQNMHHVAANGKDSEASEVIENNSAQDNREVKLKSPIKVYVPRSSTLMKPTASYLAKQNQPRGEHSNKLLQRFYSGSGNSMDMSSQRSSLNDCHATKRQKLDTGYFCKVLHLKHQTSLLHKVPKKAGLPEVSSAVTRSKSTIPKEPNLETALRAQRYRSKINAALSERTKSNAFNFIAHPLNRKILEAPTLLPPKKSKPQMPEFQVFHLKTSERAVQDISHDLVDSPYVSNSRNAKKCTRRPSSLHYTKQEKCVKVEKCKARPLYKVLSHNEESGVFLSCKDGTVSGKFNFLAHKRFPDDPPTELLSKLSLSSECRHSTKSHCKGHFPDNCLKENVPDFLDQEHEVMNKFVQNSQWLAKQRLCQGYWIYGDGRKTYS